MYLKWYVLNLISRNDMLTVLIKESHCSMSNSRQSYSHGSKKNQFVGDALEEWGRMISSIIPFYSLINLNVWILAVKGGYFVIWCTEVWLQTKLQTSTSQRSWLTEAPIPKEEKKFQKKQGRRYRWTWCRVVSKAKSFQKISRNYFRFGCMLISSVV